MKKYSSINQFRNVIKEVKTRFDYKGKDADGNAIFQHTENYPILKFRGTVKLHGTNASIVKYADNRLEYQSRERILSLNEDNANFMNEMMKIEVSFLFKNIEFKDYCAVSGDWCGGRIQKGVAINALPKMFVIFGIKADDNWIELKADLHDNANRIYNILQFPTFEVDIDFNEPELAQNEMIELTNEVEKSCPVGKFFGVEGIGEGIVFTAVNDQSLKFKSKGEKHSVTKVKKLNAIDTETMNSIKEFVEAIVTENRLEQGITFFEENNIEIDSKNTGQFLSWIVRDVLKEENDTLLDNHFDEKNVKNAIVAKARIWFLNKI
ncbi:MAG: RNA ligase family protein [Fluviicola sp.]